MWIIIMVFVSSPTKNYVFFCSNISDIERQGNQIQDLKRLRGSLVLLCYENNRDQICCERKQFDVW